MPDIELNTADERILEVLEEGRNTPSNIAGRLDYSREYVAQRLKRLREHEVVEQVNRGVYELSSETHISVSEDLLAEIHERMRPEDDYEAVLWRLVSEDDTTASDPGESRGTEAEEDRDVSADAPKPVLDVDSLDLDAPLTDDRRGVLLEFVEWVAARDGPIKKSDYGEEFWNDDRADRAGYNQRSFWEVFAKPAMKQSGRFGMPNARAYRWVGDGDD